MHLGRGPGITPSILFPRGEKHLRRFPLLGHAFFIERAENASNETAVEHGNAGFAGRFRRLEAMRLGLQVFDIPERKALGGRISHVLDVLLSLAAEVFDSFRPWRAGSMAIWHFEVASSEYGAGRMPERMSLFLNHRSGEQGEFPVCWWKRDSHL